MKKIIFLTSLLLSSQFSYADNETPPPGYWSYDGQAISFCFQFNQEDICSKLPMDKLRKIILESDKNKEKIISSVHKLIKISTKKKSLISNADTNHFS